MSWAALAAVGGERGEGTDEVLAGELPEERARPRTPTARRRRRSRPRCGAAPASLPARARSRPAAPPSSSPTACPRGRVRAGHQQRGHHHEAPSATCAGSFGVSHAPHDGRWTQRQPQLAVTVLTRRSKSATLSRSRVACAYWTVREAVTRLPVTMLTKRRVTGPQAITPVHQRAAPAQGAGREAPAPTRCSRPTAPWSSSPDRSTACGPGSGADAAACGRGRPGRPPGPPGRTWSRRRVPVPEAPPARRDHDA